MTPYRRTPCAVYSLRDNIFYRRFIRHYPTLSDMSGNRRVFPTSPRRDLAGGKLPLNPILSEPHKAEQSSLATVRQDLNVPSRRGGEASDAAVLENVDQGVH